MILYKIMQQSICILDLKVWRINWISVRVDIFINALYIQFEHQNSAQKLYGLLFIYSCLYETAQNESRVWSGNIFEINPVIWRENFVENRSLAQLSTTIL